MNINLHLQPLVALVAGILILIVASFSDMDHRDLFDRSRRIGSAWQIRLQDWVSSQDDGRACLVVPVRGLSDINRYSSSTRK